MNRPFRFAVQGGPLDDAARLADHARRVEALGYQELYTYDHVGADPDREGAREGPGSIDPFAPLVVAATATDRLRVGPLVINNELHNTALLARTAATVDRLTGGRLVLGLGTGYDEAEHDWIGSPIRRPGPRVDRFAESLEVLRSLLDDGAAELDGEHVRVHLADLGVRPVNDHVPFLIGGHGRRVVSLAGRFADIFQFTGLVHGEGGKPSGGGFALDQVVERAGWLSEAAGPRDSDIERSALVQFTAVGPDAPAAAELSERFRLDAEVIEHTPFALFGSLEQVVDEIERLREHVGISHFVVRDAEGFAPVVEALAGR
ncbi:MAG: TIGR03621 family F420-dependent LLM class oxidoreductase [Ilumatobacter sp.]|uniref:TIGR03621 family F420-dependent LLM class oxidoreductase n=1 Tax=Ilumatobacter sp. TaxID=1967498 RepID=UPI002637D5C3|nr:TIGR03621 family F420-dependent LLM class oxidoreductase [Ilumatobacter sp.]MDJ0771795.1 TIGR03621 family F420-dependent LLM class oxidoreductase [Ilumatobacter sp.]